MSNYGPAMNDHLEKEYYRLGLIHYHALCLQVCNY